MNTANFAERTPNLRPGFRAVHDWLFLPRFLSSVGYARPKRLYIKGRPLEVREYRIDIRTLSLFTECSPFPVKRYVPASAIPFLANLMIVLINLTSDPPVSLWYIRSLIARLDREPPSENRSDTGTIRDEIGQLGSRLEFYLGSSQSGAIRMTISLLRQLEG